MVSAEQDSRVAEHFEDYEKQSHALRFGMWVFLGSETLLFAGLFALYTGYRGIFPDAFHVASRHNEVLIGTANTVVLITSSFTVAWALHSIQNDRRRTAALSLVATLALASTFLVLKLIEYSHHFEEGIYPGRYYSFSDLPEEGAALFFSMYYLMTGLHALHVVAGIGVISWLLVRTLRRRMDASRHAELELGAMYWHLVDVVWIFLWPLLYLVG